MNGHGSRSSAGSHPVTGPPASDEQARAINLRTVSPDIARSYSDSFVKVDLETLSDGDEAEITVELVSLDSLLAGVRFGHGSSSLLSINMLSTSVPPYRAYCSCSALAAASAGTPAGAWPASW